MSSASVLIVDDHEGFLESAERFLSTLPHVRVIGRALNGREAVELTETLRPDVVLIDLAMPEMGGLQATRLIKAQSNPPWVVMVSHYDDAQHREHAAKAGADAFVSKLWYVHEIRQVLEIFEKRCAYV
ncbi:MAG: response regulator [Nevskiales bacterium]